MTKEAMPVEHICLHGPLAFHLVKLLSVFFVHVEFRLAPDTYIITSKENFVKLCFPFLHLHSTAY